MKDEESLIVTENKNEPSVWKGGSDVFILAV